MNRKGRLLIWRAKVAYEWFFNISEQEASVGLREVDVDTTDNVKIASFGDCK